MGCYSSECCDTATVPKGTRPRHDPAQAWQQRAQCPLSVQSDTWGIVLHQQHTTESHFAGTDGIALSLPRCSSNWHRKDLNLAGGLELQGNKLMGLESFFSPQGRCKRLILYQRFLSPRQTLPPREEKPSQSCPFSRLLDCCHVGWT